LPVHKNLLSGQAAGAVLYPQPIAARFDNIASINKYLNGKGLFFMSTAAEE
jgi:hypothetical protein